MAPRNLQFVWPKDGPKGKSGHRGFWGRMNNILTNRGPDVFLQHKGSHTAIKPDFWGNWDSYHSQADHFKEVTGPFASRVCGKRYDPYTRRYVDWMIPADWSGQFIDPNTGLAEYPRFTADEARKIWRETRGGRRPLDPQRMGSEWYHDGPKRFRQEHDHFWQDAHRAGENRRLGFAPTAGVNPFLYMHIHDDVDLGYWRWYWGL